MHCQLQSSLISFAARTSFRLKVGLMAERAKIRTAHIIHKAMSVAHPALIVSNQAQQRLAPALEAIHTNPMLQPQACIPRGLVSMRMLGVHQFCKLRSCCGTKSLSFCGCGEESTKRGDNGVAQPCLEYMHPSPLCKTQRMCECCSS